MHMRRRTQGRHPSSRFATCAAVLACAGLWAAEPALADTSLGGVTATATTTVESTVETTTAAAQPVTAAVEETAPAGTTAPAVTTVQRATAPVTSTATEVAETAERVTAPVASTVERAAETTAATTEPVAKTVTETVRSPVKEPSTTVRQTVDAAERAVAPTSPQAGSAPRSHVRRPSSHERRTADRSSRAQRTASAADQAAKGVSGERSTTRDVVEAGTRKDAGRATGPGAATPTSNALAMLPAHTETASSSVDGRRQAAAEPMRWSESAHPARDGSSRGVGGGGEGPSPAGPELALLAAIGLAAQLLGTRLRGPRRGFHSIFLISLLERPG